MKLLPKQQLREGVDGYFGYPITPQSEVMEYLILKNRMSGQGWLFSRPKVK